MNATDQPAKPEPATPVERAEMNVAEAVGQLRALVCGLGAAVLVVSAALTAFVWKQNRNLNAAIQTRKRQITQIQSTQQRLLTVVNELAKHSLGKPELTAIFTRHGMELAQPTEPAPGQTGPSP